MWAKVEDCLVNEPWIGSLRWRETETESERTKEVLSCQGTEFTKEDDQVNFVRVF